MEEAFVRCGCSELLGSSTPCNPNFFKIMSSSSSESSDEDCIAAVAVLYLLSENLLNLKSKKRCRISVVNGASYVAEVLQDRNNSCFENFRMSKDMFSRLRNKLLERGLVRDMAGVEVDEQLAIFLYTIGHNVRIHELQDRFHHSGETISRHFNNMLIAILALKEEYIQLPEPTISPVLRFNKNFYPYFKNCIGVIDGLHIPTTVRKEDQALYLNKKGFSSQNVMVAVSLDRTFVYVDVEWEGSTNDTKVLRLALENGGFKVPEGKYYLVGSRYANLSNFIAPYRGQCHHLSDFQSSDRSFCVPTEMFNHRHAQLRNVAQQTLSVLKARFPILNSAPHYPYTTQTNLVIAACVIHNFIRCEQMEDSLFDIYDRKDFPVDSDSNNELEDPNMDVQADQHAGAEIRREIADLLWSTKNGTTEPCFIVKLVILADS